MGSRLDVCTVVVTEAHSRGSGTGLRNVISASGFDETYGANHLPSIPRPAALESLKGHTGTCLGPPVAINDIEQVTLDDRRSKVKSVIVKLEASGSMEVFDGLVELG